jgi:hypothetical protein
MALSTKAVKQTMVALADQTLGNEVASAINNGNALALQSLASCAKAIVATSTSTTTDFGWLAVGDLVAVIPASAGNSHFVTCATAGTLPESAVIGSLYLGFRQFAAPAATAVKF